LTPEQILEAGRAALDIEIAELQAVRSRLDDGFVEAVRRIFACRGKVVLTGLGKSGLVARKIAATLSSTGTLAVFLHPAEGLHGDLGMVGGGDVVLALSKSGVTEEIITLFPVFRRLGCAIIALVGDLESPMAQKADVVLDGAVSKEACPNNLAPTASTTVALALGDALAVVLTRLRGFRPEDFAVYHPGGRLGKRLILRVEDIMFQGQDLPVCPPEVLMSEVLVAMTSKGMGCVNVVAPDGALLGLITDGDLRRALLRHPDLLSRTAREIMTPGPRSVAPHTLAYNALVEMEKGERQISVLPVVDEAGRLVGLIRVHDLVKMGL
jgi:arabinose-5-phosphate isomerase